MFPSYPPAALGSPRKGSRGRPAGPHVSGLGPAFENSIRHALYVNYGRRSGFNAESGHAVQKADCPGKHLWGSGVVFASCMAEVPLKSLDSGFMQSRRVLLLSQGV